MLIFLDGHCFQELAFLQFCLFFLDGRHFKPVYGKDLVDTLITNADQLMAELEKEVPERLSAHQNSATAMQGQIDLIRSHQASQDRRIGFALAREAEEADSRSNERFAQFCVFLLFFCFFCASLFSIF